MTPDYGIIWLRNVKKPICAARKITRGERKGQYQVTLTRGRAADGSPNPGNKVFVEEKDIVSFPPKGKPPKGK
jgi:hypothetical protein